MLDFHHLSLMICDHIWMGTRCGLAFTGVAKMRMDETHVSQLTGVVIVVVIIDVIRDRREEKALLGENTVVRFPFLLQFRKMNEINHLSTFV